MPRGLRLITSGICAVFVAAGLAVSVAGQTPPPGAKGWTAPRTPDGHPDLQGVWDYRTITPMERPAELADKPVLSEQEVAEYEREQATSRNRDRRDGSAAADVARAYNQFWWDYGSKVVGTRRTSLIVDPPDGRIPPMTPEGQARLNARRAFQTTSAREEAGVGRGFDSWLDRPLAERCLLWGVAGPPMVPGPYNNNVQIFQNRDFVVIVNEMIHEHRMVPLDGRPHLAPAIRQWMGDSRGRWEGDTLVVETKNFTNKTTFRGASDQMQLTERVSRVAPDTLLYEFTINDPATFTKPWTAAIPMTKSTELMYEYACHEGNYSLEHALEGARNQEKAAGREK
jgi:hypothetical protein